MKFGKNVSTELTTSDLLIYYFDTWTPRQEAAREVRRCVSDEQIRFW